MSQADHASDASAPGTDPTYIPSSESTSFIETSGGLLTEQTIVSLRQERFDHPAVTAETFALPGETSPTENELEEEIALVWEDLVERWDEVTQKGRLFEMDISKARSKWILKFLEALDFEPIYQRAHLEVEGMEFDLSHTGWPDGDIADYGEMGGATAPIIHTLAPEREREQTKENKLDRKPEGAGRGTPSPHDALQNFLNASKDQVWALLTDGVTLRVLRDFYHTYTRGYVEFDLENIFTSRNYQDFRAMYRLCHASRYLPRDNDALDKSVSEVLKDDRDEAAQDEESEIETPLEMLYQTSLSTGVKVGQDLQSNVISALETLGNGLLNPEIREFLREGGDEAAQEYYQELLMLIYRLLFLLYAEQRGMMPGRNSLYTDEYSITKLRERAERRRGQDDPNTDLWYGLQASFKLAEGGDENLGVPAYNGMLFDSARLEHISDSECTNEALLSAISDLTLIEREGVLQRISYADLGVEEVGSIYESLLEFTPRLATEHVEVEDQAVPPGEFYLDDRGTERRETGSYYTDPQLVQELIKSALKPVVDDRLENAEDTKEEKETALLDIKVVDPACGSAAFLIAATNYLGKRLAEIRGEVEYPLEEDVRDARRSVLQHCIYGVDLNPMATELAKVSLWIDSAVQDKPLNFLDHHIKCGNSLIGTNSELLEGEFPADAYATSSGRDWHVGNEIRKRVRKENKGRAKGSNDTTLQQWGTGRENFVSLAEKIESIDEDTASEIKKKKDLYRDLRKTEAFKREKLAYDVWTAAFYWPMDGSLGEYPSPSTIEKIRRNPNPDDPALVELKENATNISEQQRFFHWELEFPDVFNGPESGFDCVLGNPPWERVKLKEREWFAGRTPEVAESNSKGHRKRLISKLKDTDPDLYERWQQASKRASQTSKFIRKSGRYPLSGNGEINTYPIFTELSGFDLLNPFGRLGMVVKTGLATDYRTQDLFGTLVENKRLVSLYDLVNEEGIFPDVAPPERFCLLTLAGSDVEVDKFEFSFFSTNLEEMRDESRRYTLTQKQIERINPNTHNCPTFPNKLVRDITLKCYEDNSVLLNDNANSNPWAIKYYNVYHMNNDTSEFEDNTLENLRERGYTLADDAIFSKGDQRYLPLYEAKFIHQFDHRFGSFDDIPEENRFVRKAQTKRISDEEKKDTNHEVIPRYWVKESEFHNRVNGFGWGEDWVFTFRGITNTTTNFRTGMGTIAPFYGFGHSAPILTIDHESNKQQNALLFISFFNSFVFDFILKQSVGGANLSLYIIKQLPMPTPEEISAIDISINGRSETLRDFLVHHALRLTWTSHSLDSLGESLEPRAGPFIWDPEDRRNRRNQIDAAIAKVYGLSRSNFEYVIDSFDILKGREINRFGEYRRRRECIEAYDEIEVKK